MEGGCEMGGKGISCRVLLGEIEEGRGTASVLCNADAYGRL